MRTHNGKIIADPVILFMALFSIIIHLIFINNLEYHRDELLYFSLGMHPAAREYGTLVYLCEEPVMSFNKFWTGRVSMLR